MKLKLLWIGMLSGMAVHAPEEPESSFWPGWNIPASFPEVSIGSAIQTFHNTFHNTIYCFVKPLFPRFYGGANREV